MINRLLLSALLLPVLAFAQGNNEQVEALALKPNLEHGREVYEICRTCHLNEGWGTKQGMFPQIAGQLSSVIVKQLVDIRSGNRDNPVMYPFAQPESIGGPQSLVDVAEYISQLPMSLDNGQGADNPEEIEEGKALFSSYCASCHGIQAEGNATLYYPKLRGQHYAYLLRQLNWIMEGKRRNANPAMTAVLAQLTEKQRENVANYISRITPPENELAPSKDWTNPDFD